MPETLAGPSSAVSTSIAVTKISLSFEDHTASAAAAVVDHFETLAEIFISSSNTLRAILSSGGIRANLRRPVLAWIDVDFCN